MTQVKNNAKAAFLLILAGVVFFVLSQFAIGRLIQWPFNIVTTFVHELGHGLMAIAVGGDFIKMELFQNGSGRAFTRGTQPGLPRALVAAAGLIAPAMCAGLFIMVGLSAKASSRLLLIFGILILLSCAIWVRTAFGLVILACFALFFLLLSRKAKGVFDQFLVQFMGMHMLVDTLTDTLRYLFKSNAEVAGQISRSDTGAIAHNLGGSYLIWAILIATLCILILVLSLKRAYFR